MNVPVGGAQLFARGVGYDGWAGGTVAAAGGATRITVKRQSGVLIRFRMANPRILTGCSIQVRVPGGKETSIGGSRDLSDGGYWHCSRQLAGGQISEVRIVQTGNEIVPWTALDDKAWPQVMQIP